MRGVFIRLLLSLLLAVPVCATASTDNAFLKARDALQKGSGQFERHAGQIPQDHPLAVYIAWWRLADTLNNPDKPKNLEGLKAFASRYPDSALSGKAREMLTRNYADSADWKGVLEQARELGPASPEMQCLVQRARIGLNDYSITLTRDIQVRFMTGNPLPDVCEALFDAMRQGGRLSDEDIFGRLRLALVEGNRNLALRLNAMLSEGQRAPRAAFNHPPAAGSILNGEALPLRAEREIALDALYRRAKDDPVAAAALWQLRSTAFSESEQRYGWGQIAVAAARQQHPAAFDWFNRTGQAQTTLQHEWQVRTLLRGKRWLDAYRAIQAMPIDLQDEPVWRYWKARAMKALNMTATAQPIFSRLAQELNYYGLLAEEELPIRAEARPYATPLSDAELRYAETHTGLKRALLLRKFNMDGEALAEWNWSLRDMNDRQLMAAAELARQARWYDRAISTAERTREVHSLDLRYLIPYRDLAESFSRDNGLDVAWVYGLMRQESRFIDAARSRVGANGLMQIMPATAKWIARQIGASHKSVKKVGLPENNIRFGTWYLKKLYDGLDRSVVLATAAYNAGPGRARKWQGDQAIEGAIYVETIPFQETRQYVKKVLANAMFYTQRLNLPQVALKDRLGMVPPRSSVPLPEDERAPGIE